MKKILSINCGSSSLKFKLFDLKDEKVIASGLADRVGLDGSTFTIKINGEKHKIRTTIPNQSRAIQTLLENLEKYGAIKDLSEIVGVGHRIVAGGEEFKDSVIINADNLKKIAALKDYAPLHNPAAVKGIKAFMKQVPNAVEVGVFDTSFHQSLDPVHYLYALPYKYYEKYHVRKYGAHGTSVRYVASQAAKMLNKDLKDLKLIICHLGSGASITAVKDGKSFDTSMGFSPLAGIMMGTRSGDVDPSAIQYIMNKENLNINQMVDILNYDSGLIGASEISSDMRDLENNPNKQARLARKMFINRIIQYVGAYTAEMNGVDAIVFTAGIGEHDAPVREKVMECLEYAGLKPDKKLNEEKPKGKVVISKPDSKIKALIIPTDEELMIERDVVRLGRLKDDTNSTFGKHNGHHPYAALR